MALWVQLLLVTDSRVRWVFQIAREKRITRLCLCPSHNSKTGQVATHSRGWPKTTLGAWQSSSR